MDDLMIDPFDTGFVEVWRRLEAYADLRLTPSLTATARMRANVLNAARRQVVAAADTSFVVPAPIATLADEVRIRAARRAWLRPAAALFAGCLTLGLLGGTAFAASPGGLLYTARLWTEMATLPAEVDARATAEVSRLDARIQEAQQAVAVGDAPATEAALVAYSSIVVEAAGGTQGDPTANAAIESSVRRHIAILTLLIDRVPEAARAALEQALASSMAVLRDLDGSGRSRNEGGSVDRPAGQGQHSEKQGVDDWLPATAQVGAGWGAGGSGNAGGQAAPGQPDKTPRPDRTAKPEKTPARETPPPADPAHPPFPGTGDGSVGD